MTKIINDSKMYNMLVGTSFFPRKKGDKHYINLKNVDDLTEIKNLNG